MCAGSYVQSTHRGDDLATARRPPLGPTGHQPCTTRDAQGANGDPDFSANAQATAPPRIHNMAPEATWAATSASSAGSRRSAPRSMATWSAASRSWSRSALARAPRGAARHCSAAASHAGSTPAAASTASARPRARTGRSRVPAGVRLANRSTSTRHGPSWAESRASSPSTWRPPGPSASPSDRREPSLPTTAMGQVATGAAETAAAGEGAPGGVGSRPVARSHPAPSTACQLSRPSRPPRPGTRDRGARRRSAGRGSRTRPEPRRC